MTCLKEVASEYSVSSLLIRGDFCNFFRGKDNEGFDSMIPYCTCAGGPASILEQARRRELLVTCKNCGGKHIVNGREALSGSMLSTVGIELTRVIDPDLTWKTVSKSNKRGARRARASLSAGNKKKHVAGGLKQTEGPIAKDLNGLEDMPVSESEKVLVTIFAIEQLDDPFTGLLGVSILGRRFSDSVESMPIKKRKFLLVRSPSPPHHTPSPQLKSECSLTNMSSSNGKLSSDRHVSKIKAVIMAEPCEADNELIDDEHYESEDIIKYSDSADFSGISILAAAACSSNIGTDATNSEEGSCSDLQNSETSSLPHELSEKHLPSSLGIPDGETDLNINIEMPVGKNMTSTMTKDVSREQGGATKAMTASLVLPEKSKPISVDLPVKQNGSVGRVQHSLLGDRTHWDLNTVMDAWDDPIVEDKPNAVCLAHEGFLHEENFEKSEHQMQMEHVGGEETRVTEGQHELGRAGITTVKEDASSFACSAADVISDKNEEVSSLVPGIHEPIREQLQLEASESDKISLPKRLLSGEIGNTSNSMVDAAEIKHSEDPNAAEEIKHSEDPNAAEETKHSEDPTSTGGGHVSACTVDSSGIGFGSTFVNAFLVAGENADAVCTSIDQRDRDETASSNIHPGTVLIISNNMSEEDKGTVTAAGVCNLCGDECITNAPAGFTVRPRSPEDEKASGCIDAALIISHGVEPDGAMLIDGNSRKTNGDEMGSQVVESKPSHDIIPCNAIIDQPKDFGVVCSCHPELPIHESFEEQCRANPCLSQDTLRADAKTEDQNITVVTDVEATLPEINVHVFKDLGHNSVNEALGTTDTKLLLDNLVSQPAERVNEGNHLSIAGEVALEDSFDGDYDSVGSHDDADKGIVVEKMGEVLADDDSQYEDGEFRVAVLHSWEDGVDEGEAEHVDYGSDNVDTEAFELAAECGSSARLQCEIFDGKNEVSSELNDRGTKYMPSQLASLKSSVSPVESVKKRASKISRKVSNSQHGRKDVKEIIEKDGNVVANLGASSENAPGHDVGSKVDFVRASSHSAVLSSAKLSGWDQLPEVCKSSGEADAEIGRHSVERNPGTVLDSSDGGAVSFRQAARMMSNRELSSRIEGPRSTDTSFRKDKIYVQGSRQQELDDSSLRSERDAGLGRSIGRGGSSGHIRGRGRGSDHWLDSSGGNWGQKRHHSTVYYDSGDFAAPKNVAAVAAAKLESNGFLVAHDGTIVKSGGVGSVGRLQRRLADASSQSMHHTLAGRGSPTERDGTLRFGVPARHAPIRESSQDRSISAGRGRSGRYGPRVFASGHRERYNGHMPDDDLDSSLPMQHHMSRRERSFSPISRRAFHLSCSHAKSRSRSRTRSPHMWTSPRGRSGGGMNGGAGFRHHSRSPPNFRSEVRMERIRSPDRRQRFASHMVGFVSASRNHGSPSHSSRWVEDKKDAPDHFRQHDYKRSSASERSPPARVLSHGLRFEMMGSPGRLKPEEYNRNLHSGRFPEFVVGRGLRHHGSDDDRRKHGERYGMIQSVRHHDIDGDVKRFRYDMEDGLRLHHSRTKNASEFTGRGGSPKDYGRDIDSRLANEPRRTREEKGHFKYDRDGKQTANFKTFGIHESDEDATSRRRRP
ncbi:hypothetical protein ACLOJK_027141 [Asimina triloba]